MKSPLLLLILLVFLTTSCTKPVKEEVGEGPFLNIVAAHTDASTVKGQEIVSRMTCEGANLCYSFSRFQITTPEPHVFNIRVQANLPNLPAVTMVCAEAIYRIDTTLKLPAAQKGIYYLRFFNGNDVFKTDTVVVQ